MPITLDETWDKMDRIFHILLDRLIDYIKDKTKENKEAIFIAYEQWQSYYDIMTPLEKRLYSRENEHVEIAIMAIAKKLPFPRYTEIKFIGNEQASETWHNLTGE